MKSCLTCKYEPSWGRPDPFDGTYLTECDHGKYTLMKYRKDCETKVKILESFDLEISCENWSEKSEAA